MAERNETDTTTAGQHAAVAPWSARLRIATLLLLVFIVAATTILIMRDSGHSARPIVASKASDTKAPPTGKTVGLDGSGIGAPDAPGSRRTPKPTQAPAVALLSTPGAGQPTQGPASVTTPTAPRSASPTPSKPAPVASSSPPATPTQPPTPKPTRTRHCIPNTPICL